MNKTIQTLLLTLVVSFAIGTRLAIGGWLFLIGLGSIILFVPTHFIVHYYSMNSLAIKGVKNFILILLSHLFFLCIFIFQIDFDDADSFFILTYVFGIENELLFKNSTAIIVGAIIAYLVIAFIIVRGTKEKQIKASNSKYLLSSLIASMILPFIVIYLLYAKENLQRAKELELTGQFNSIRRAVKNPSEVIVLKSHPKTFGLSSFPSKIMELPKVQIIDLNRHRISKIPEDLHEIESLKVLNLMDNKIKEIPPSICNCKNLEELRVGGHIQSFPNCLKNMQSLKHLSIQSNTVNELMEELRGFKYLETSHFYLKDGVLDKKRLAKIRKETGIKHKY